MKCKLSIQEKLKDLRIEKGLSLQELSEQTGISRASLGNYETDDYKEISHKAIITLADFYGVTSDYLLGLTENREQHQFPVDELGLDDGTVDLLKSGKLNVRLICEMIKNPDFKNFLSDMEIYVDNLAGMQFRNINKMIEQTRVRLQSKGISDEDHYMKTLEAATISEDNYFNNLLGNDIVKIAKAIRDAHGKDAETGDATTPVDDILDSFEELKTADNVTQAPDKWDLFKKYNIRDVEVEMNIHKRLYKYPVPNFVWDEYHLDQRINDRGILIDMDLVRQAISMDEAAQNELQNALKNITGLDGGICK